MTEPTITEGAKEILLFDVRGQRRIDPVEERFKELETRIHVLETSLVQRIESAFKRIGHVF